jgi:glyoxalase family protein
MEPINGLHHVTAVTRDAQQNVDFYRNVLGQRLVKKTVNFDVPDTYHLYFADAVGTPGSVLTFFAWPNMKRGTRGTGETLAVSYNIPAESMSFWQRHLKQQGVELLPAEKRFGMDVLVMEDPDGMRVELVASGASPAIRHWDEGPIPPEYALRGFHGVTLWLEEIESTADLLSRTLGYTFTEQEESRHRFQGGSGLLGSTVDILYQPGLPEDRPVEAVFGGGSIHHIAFRVPDDETQLRYQSAVRAAGLEVTPVIDRQYFHSIYFREPGGVLLEIATAGPGFAIDEPVQALGESLKLPAWFEPNRAGIEANLADLSLKPIEKTK